MLTSCQSQSHQAGLPLLNREDWNFTWQLILGRFVINSGPSACGPWPPPLDVSDNHCLLSLFSGRFGSWTLLRWWTQFCSTLPGVSKDNNWWEHSAAFRHCLTLLALALLHFSISEGYSNWVKVKAGLISRRRVTVMKTTFSISCLYMESGFLQKNNVQYFIGCVSVFKLMRTQQKSFLGHALLIQICPLYSQRTYVQFLRESN